MFAVKEISEVTCTQEHVSWTTEVHTSFPPVRPADGLDLMDALGAFMAASPLEGANQYDCERCGCLCDAFKSSSFPSCPYVLAIPVGRFATVRAAPHMLLLHSRWRL